MTITIDELYTETAAEKLTRAGFTKVNELPAETVSALAALSEEDLKALLSAQESFKGKVTNVHGLAIF